MTLWRIRPYDKGIPSRISRICAFGALAVVAILGADAAHAQSGSAKLTTPLSVDWKYTGNYYGNNPAAPVVSKDSAYFATGNRLFAVSLQNGALKWRYPADPTSTLPALVGVTPILDGGALYVGAADGLYSFEAETGKLNWHYTAGGGVVTTPVVNNGAVYFISGNGRIHAVNPATGDAVAGVWKRGGTLGVDAGGVVTADTGVFNGTIYYVTSTDILHAINMGTGVQQWYQRLPSSTPGVSVPIISGETIYLASGSTLINIRLVTGQNRWSIPLPSAVVVPPTVDAEGNAYVVLDNKQIYSVNQRGRGVWARPATVDYLPSASPVVADGMLLVPTASGGMYAFDQATGALKWHYLLSPSSTNVNRIPTRLSVSASPVVMNGSLYVLSDDGALTAFRHDAPDSLPPVVKVVEPEEGDYLNGRAPFHITAKISDEGSGVDLSSLVVKLDGRGLTRLQPGAEASGRDGYTFDIDTYTLDYSTSETEGRSSALSDGHHTATVSAKDWKGNQISKTWTFYIDDTIPRKARRSPNQSQFPGGRGGSSSSGFGGGAKGGGGG